MCIQYIYIYIHTQEKLISMHIHFIVTLYHVCIMNIVYIINDEFFWQIIAMSWCNLGGSFLFTLGTAGDF